MTINCWKVIVKNCPRSSYQLELRLLTHLECYSATTKHSSSIGLRIHRNMSAPRSTIKEKRVAALISHYLVTISCILHGLIVAVDPLKDCVGSKLPPDLAQLNLPDRHFVVVDSAGQYYICCVSIIDLDPKRFDKIPFYLTEEQTVVNSYSKLIGGETIYAV